MLQMNDHQQAEQYIKDHSKHTVTEAQQEGVGANGEALKEKPATSVRTATQTEFLGYMDTTRQLPADMVKSVAEGLQLYTTGAALAARTDLENAITAAKKAGEDPDSLVAVVKSSTPFGQIRVGVSATSLVPIPKTGERVTRHGRTSVQIRTHALDDTVLQETHNVITALMGGDK